MFSCFLLTFLVKKIHCKKKRWLRFIRRPWFGFSATEKRKHVSISPTVESMLKLLDSFLGGAPETKSMVQLFSPCWFGNQNLSAEQSKMKVWQFQTCRPKKGECRRIQIRDMKKYSGHFWTTFFWWTVLWSPSPTPCWLCNCQDHLQSSFAQVLGEIRSQSSLAHLLCSAPGFLPCERVHNSPLGPAVSRCGLDSHPHKHPRNTGDDAGSLWVESATLFNADLQLASESRL